MENVTVRDLRHHGKDVLTRVTHGEHLLVTRDGIGVAELTPVRRKGRPTKDLIAVRKRLPSVDAAQMLADIDDVLDADL